MLESKIEKKFVEAVNNAGGWALKFVPTYCAGMPDRLVLWPGGRATWVELKAPGKKLRRIQEHRKQELNAKGFKVYCVDSEEKIADFVAEYAKR